MVVEVRIPSFGESVNEVTLTKWLKKEGDYVVMDESICELESEKATNELPAEQSGILHIKAPEGSVLQVGSVIATIEAAVSEGEKKTQSLNQSTTLPPQERTEQPVAGPAAAKLMRELGVTPESGSGKGGRITKADVLQAISKDSRQPDAGEAPHRGERREKMSSLRKSISRHLVAAKNTTAMLTTFNEVDLKNVQAIRSQFKQAFREQYGVSLGLMGFFTRACCLALKEFPALNARIDNDEIVYHDYCDISIAVSTPKGLVVPVIRNAERLRLHEIEQVIAALSRKGRENKLTLEEMTGGTFTISNGGVFGSLLSTPIINTPQSAILGMHKIQDRVVVVDGTMQIRPMMYLALSYDHRIVDGRESVSFLVRVKELLEHPEQLVNGIDPVRNLLGL